MIIDYCESMVYPPMQGTDYDKYLNTPKGQLQIEIEKLVEEIKKLEEGIKELQKNISNKMKYLTYKQKYIQLKKSLNLIEYMTF